MARSVGGYRAIRQQGFALVVALFMIVAMAAAITLMQLLHGVQTTSSDFAVQRARALAAANSGLEWAVYQVNATKACPAASTTLNLAGSGVDGFSVQVTCSLDTLREAGTPVYWFSLTAFASSGSFTASPDFVSRRIAVNVAL